VPDPVAALTERLPLTSVAAMEAVIAAGDPPAAIIIELTPEGIDPTVLQELRNTCDRLGTVLIWDEIVTGFRWAPGGAQSVYGVTPDLTCLGKALANGLPLAALVGRAELMSELRSVFFSGTFGGETVSLAAAKATVETIRAGEVCPHIWSMGERLRTGLTELIGASGLEIELQGEPPRSALQFRVGGEPSAELRGLFLQETVRRGVLFGGPIFTTFAHGVGHIDHTLDACAEALRVLETAVETDSVRAHLDGSPPGVVFKPVR
jgi:glutamate-1-semialdehyde aminotransferase